MDELCVTASVENLDRVISFLDERLEQAECPMKIQMQMDVAAEEIFVNIAYYAYPDGVGDVWVRLLIKKDEGEIELEFADSGVPFNPLDKADPEVEKKVSDDSIGGLGIYMVKKSMDEVSYRYENQKNIFCMKKKYRTVGCD